MHEDVEGWILGAQLHHSLPYYLVSGSLTEPGARLMASSPRDLVPPIVSTKVTGMHSYYSWLCLYEC